MGTWGHWGGLAVNMYESISGTSKTRSDLHALQGTTTHAWRDMWAWFGMLLLS